MWNASPKFFMQEMDKQINNVDSIFSIKKGVLTLNVLPKWESQNLFSDKNFVIKWAHWSNYFLFRDYGYVPLTQCSSPESVEQALCGLVNCDLGLFLTFTFALRRSPISIADSLSFCSNSAIFNWMQTFKTFYATFLFWIF